MTGAVPSPVDGAVSLSFHGAAGTVTGSRYLLETNGHRLLIDCGLFQGYKQLRLRNWSPLPFDPSSIDAVVLTHAHIDHSGYLPALVRDGFGGSIYCSAGALDLCKLLLPDSAHLHEEDAKFLNRHKATKHRPALPLYTIADAEACLERFRHIALTTEFEPAPGFRVSLLRAGHMLGACFARIATEAVSLTFSGDLGRSDDPILHPPVAPAPSDYLICESTYGDRNHPRLDPEAELGERLAAACERRGVIVIPAFAVGRAQTMLLLVARLKRKNLLPDIPVYLDSPMAIDATSLYQKFRHEHRLSDEECRQMCHAATLVNTSDQSRELDVRSGPMIIISASGMATGGRVIHHLKAFVGDARNLVLLTGFQAPGTRGFALANGATALRMHGEEFAVRAEVAQLRASSSHADADGILAWLRQMGAAPRHTFVTHGEPVSSDALRFRIEHELGWDVSVPEYRQQVMLPLGERQ